MSACPANEIDASADGRPKAGWKMEEGRRRRKEEGKKWSGTGFQTTMRPPAPAPARSSPPSFLLPTVRGACGRSGTDTNGIRAHLKSSHMPVQFLNFTYVQLTARKIMTAPEDQYVNFLSVYRQLAACEENTSSTKSLH